MVVAASCASEAPTSRDPSAAAIDSPTTMTTALSTTTLAIETTGTSWPAPAKVMSPSASELAGLTLTGTPPKGGDGVNHGGEYWAVYIAVAGSDSAYELAAWPDGVYPVIERLRAEFSKVGVFLGDGGTDCDIGGRDVLSGYDADLSAAVYYERESDARAFAALLSRPPLGVGRIKAFCAD